MTLKVFWCDENVILSEKPDPPQKDEQNERNQNFTSFKIHNIELVYVVYSRLKSRLNSGKNMGT